jgi:hypothetical protein
MSAVHEILDNGEKGGPTKTSNWELDVCKASLNHRHALVY